jgi:hypothetical protein
MAVRCCPPRSGKGSRLKFRAVAKGLALGWLLAFSWGDRARADGGTLRLWERRGNYEIAVFTAPGRIVAGPVDMSIMLLDAASGEPATNANVNVELARPARAAETFRYPATRGAATNKLLYAALFEIPAPGAWAVEVVIEGAREPAKVRFTLEAGESGPAWIKLWPWVCWPVPVIALYAVHQRLVWRRTRGQVVSELE